MNFIDSLSATVERLTHLIQRLEYFVDQILNLSVDEMINAIDSIQTQISDFREDGLAIMSSLDPVSVRYAAGYWTRGGPRRRWISYRGRPKRAGGWHRGWGQRRYTWRPHRYQQERNYTREARNQAVSVNVRRGNVVMLMPSTRQAVTDILPLVQPVTWPTTREPPEPQFSEPSPLQPLFSAPQPQFFGPQQQFPELSAPQPQFFLPSPPQSQFSEPSPPQPHFPEPSPPQPHFPEPFTRQPQFSEASPAQPQLSEPSAPQPQISEASARHSEFSERSVPPPVFAQPSRPLPQFINPPWPQLRLALPPLRLISRVAQPPLAQPSAGRPLFAQPPTRIVRAIYRPQPVRMYVGQPRAEQEPNRVVNVSIPVRHRYRVITINQRSSPAAEHSSTVSGAPVVPEQVAPSPVGPEPAEQVVPIPIVTDPPNSSASFESD